MFVFLTHIMIEPIQLKNKDESSIGAVNVFYRCIIQIELLMDRSRLSETRVRYDIFFVTAKNKVNLEIKKTYE